MKERARAREPSYSGLSHTNTKDGGEIPWHPITALSQAAHSLESRFVGNTGVDGINYDRRGYRG